MSDPVISRPLLTIAIPTYNRSASLARLLTVLAPQLTSRPEIDLFISDNHSPDDTEAVVREFLDDGLKARYVRQPENIGSDRNFLTCFENGRGRYFWMCGDDDVICPGSIDKVMQQIGGGEEIDLLYLTSYGFQEDFVTERREDPLGRRFHTYTDARLFARVVNIMFTFISGIIVNRDRLMEIPHEAPSAFLSSNLIQLSWCLPLLLYHRRSVVIWDRVVAGQMGSAGGYALGKVFGRGLRNILERLLPGRRDLQDAILNPTLQHWFGDTLCSMLAAKNEKLGLATVKEDLRMAYGDKPRYWLFVDPVLWLPLPMARAWVRGSVIVKKTIFVLTVPRFWRKEN